MKILLTGAAGQVGRAFARSVPPQHAVICKTHADLDIGDRNSVAEALAASGAAWLVNAAAYTAVDLAEKEPHRANAINATAVGVLAEESAAAGCRFLHLSTDFVFDGDSSKAYQVSDLVHPLGVYGTSKAHGESLALAYESSVVLRTSWVYAAYGKNFVLTMLRLMSERPEVRVVSDQIGSPTWASSIAAALWACIDRTIAGGIYHWGDLGVASWYDFAVAIQEEALERGLLTRAIPVVPIATSEYPTPARRPAFSVLDTRSSRAAIGLEGAHWRTHLRMMLDELRTA